jgi:IS605 OrfB family transposase
MILTYKIKHNRDFSTELGKALQVAQFGIKHNVLSSKAVKQFGLKSIISNQVLRKYVKNKKIKQVHKVNLIIPNQGINVNRQENTISIPSLKFSFGYHYLNNFEKINQIEINSQFIFVSVTVNEKEQSERINAIGVDLNTTGHAAVIANPQTGKVIKLGKKANHIHTKYKNIRKDLQKKNKYKKVKTIKTRESRIVKDLNHKMSKKIVQTAIESNSNINLEDLTGIRKTAKSRKSFKYALNSWSFYQLKQMIEYKAKLQGVKVVNIDPRYTSKSCSRCGLLGNRNGKTFKCPHCGHVAHSDVNAGFNIALRSNTVEQLHTDKDVCNGNTDIPKEATILKAG